MDDIQFEIEPKYIGIYQQSKMNETKKNIDLKYFSTMNLL